jgi:pimeloyl-ACP methyl ester carboxylesterase
MGRQITLATTVACWCAVAWAGQELAPPESPQRLAEGHLRRAREYAAASCAMLQKHSRHAVDGYYVACEEAWNAVWTCPESPAVLCDAAEIYADSLAGLLEAARCHGRLTADGLWIGNPRRPILVPWQPKALPIAPEAIRSIEPQAQADDGRITRRHVRAGFGLPVVVRLAAGGEADPLRQFTPARLSIAATAVLRFRMPGDEKFLQTFAGPVYRDHAAAVLDLANPVEIAAVHIGPARPHLAADLTAPLLDMLAAMPKSDGIQGFIQPFGAGDTQPRLELLEPHQPGRIPVVFIHGLASDEGTWFDMLNELRAWPAFHRRFEPWVYHYPTGASFLQMSAVLRRELQAAVRAVDPQDRDPAMRHMVLVGHSMGGLHAKMQVIDPGTALWDAVATRPYAELRLPATVKTMVAKTYFFRPLPFVKRVVYVATPHRGSALAAVGVGRLASITVRQPPETAAIHEMAVRMNPGLLRPDFERRLPTTIDILRPESPYLQVLEGLRPPCWVATHSIVGDAHISVTGGRDDCVVPVESAHTPGALSEITVPASHTRVHHHPEAIGELQRILCAHLREFGGGGPDGGVREAAFLPGQP